MVGRPLMLATLLGASIGVPYAVSNSSKGPTPPTAAAPGMHTPAAIPPTSSWGAPAIGSSIGLSNPVSTTPTPPSLVGSVPPTNAAYPTTPYPATTYIAPLVGGVPTSGIHHHAIQDVFRFNVTKEWVYQNFDRKSTGLGDPGLFGVRVQLVTGTRMNDLAGALTYYFDGQGQVQHISFRGRTADTTPIVQFLQQTYQFQRMESLPGEQLYQVRDGENVYSELRTKPESVLIESTPHGSFGVVVELGRPGSNRPLTPPAPQLEIPEVASSTPPADSAAHAGTEAAAEGAEATSKFVGDIRPPTEVEHGQLRAHRWPN